MLHLSTSINYYLCCSAVDMRKGIFGLCGLVHNMLQQNVLHGDVFVFINKRRDTIKLLQWDKDGFALYEKKLSKGTFEHKVMQGEQKILLTNYQLQCILQGILLQKISTKPRYGR